MNFLFSIFRLMIITLALIALTGMDGNRQEFFFYNNSNIEKASVNSKETGRNPAKIIWYWEDSFPSDEKEKIVEWLEITTHAVCSILGNYPFDIHLHIYKREGAREPVPWANTWRYPEQSVHFYVNPDYSIEEFLDDWTAPHEISHLSIPYLGEKNAWFAEGYASFMQYQVMNEMGIYTEQEVKDRYQSKIDRIKHNYESDENFVSIARTMKKTHRYPEMYWGGSTYFINLDNQLRDKYNTSLMEVITKYQQCCRLKDSNLEDVIASWDEIIRSNLAGKLLREYNTKAAKEMISRIRFQD